MLQQSRSYILSRYPYFHPTLLGFIPHHVKDIGTMFVTESMVLGVDMEWFGTLDVEIAAGCLIHEVMHILRDITRIDAMEDGEIAGYAFDMPINDDLKTFGIKLPEWVVYSSTHGLPPGLTGERYYELLKQKGVRPPRNRRVGSGNCGSCAGHTEVHEIDEQGHIPAEVQHFRKMGVNAIREHMSRGGFGRGDIPNSLKEILTFTGREEAVIPWQQILGSKVDGAFGRIVHGHSDYSLRKPAKRSYAVGMVRPGLIGHVPDVCFIEDSSGSMGATQIKENRVEAANIMAQLGLDDIWFLNADIIVQTQPQRIGISDLKTLPVTGRGGTDFRPAIEQVLKLRPVPDLCIYSTDGDGEAPLYQPRAISEFIWLLAPGRWTRSPCNWGLQILTTNDRAERKKFKIL